MINEADKTRISNAIRAAEETTAGEIFCVIAKQSGTYHLIPLAWAAAVAFVVPLPLIYWHVWPANWIYIFQLAVFAALALALSLPALLYRVVPRHTMDERAHSVAVTQFLAQGLHQTEQRTGVLIFASVAERYAEVIADSGINDKVDANVWQSAIDELIGAIKAGRPADGFIAAIERCRMVLSAHFPPGSLNPDELPNKLVEI